MHVRRALPSSTAVEPLPIRKAPGKSENDPQNDISSENSQRGQISSIIAASGLISESAGIFRSALPASYTSKENP
jgi:hypothetical protein